MTTKISRWCSCGASCSITVANQDAPMARLVIDEFNTLHYGPDHRPTDAKGAAAGRRREERRMERERREEKALW